MVDIIVLASRLRKIKKRIKCDDNNILYLLVEITILNGRQEMAEKLTMSITGEEKNRSLKVRARLGSSMRYTIIF